jgi:hypothetical protein
MGKVCNAEIRSIVQAERTVLDRRENRKIKLLGNLTTMPKERWPAKIHSWIPAGRRKRRGPRWSWWDGITESMAKRGVVEEDACCILCYTAYILMIIIYLKYIISKTSKQSISPF